MERNRRQRARRDKQQRIVQAAAELFRAQGFDATTTDQIAERADVAKGTIFRYAPTKAHLLALVYEQDLEQIVGRAFASTRPDAPVVTALAGVFFSFYELYEQDAGLARQFVRDQLFIAPHQADAPGALQTLLVELAALVRVWQAAGRVAPDVDAALVAQNSFALYFTVLVSWLSGWLPREQRDERLRASLSLLWRGLVSEADADAGGPPRGNSGERL
jgi:TetR/AcrR family transcriptional regulator, cholesterol catabolism regulator